MTDEQIKQCAVNLKDVRRLAVVTGDVVRAFYDNSNDTENISF